MVGGREQNAPFPGEEGMNKCMLGWHDDDSHIGDLPPVSPWTSLALCALFAALLSMYLCHMYHGPTGLAACVVAWLAIVLPTVLVARRMGRMKPLTPDQLQKLKDAQVMNSRPRGCRYARRMGRRDAGALFRVALKIWCRMGLHRWVSRGEPENGIVHHVTLLIETCEHCNLYRVWGKERGGRCSINGESIRKEMSWLRTGNEPRPGEGNINGERAPLPTKQKPCCRSSATPSGGSEPNP